MAQIKTNVTGIIQYLLGMDQPKHLSRRQRRLLRQRAEEAREREEFLGYMAWLLQQPKRTRG